MAVKRSMLVGLAVSLAALPRGAQAEGRDVKGAEALRADLERVIADEESSWFIDAKALEQVHPTAMESVCRASREARAEAAARLANEAAQAGDPRALFERAGKTRTAEVDRALHLQRMRLVLDRAIERADAECPFWLVPERGFAGRQTDRGRFSLSLETGGLIQVRQTAGGWTYGGGGVARLLPGYGFGRVTLLAGFEFAGGAMLKIEEGPVGSSQFVVNYFPAVPIVLRVHDTNVQYDFEAAGVSLFQADNGRFSYGARVGFGLAFKALRTRFVLPWAGAAIAYEHYFESGGRPAAEFVRAGLRVGFQWAP